MKKKDFSGRHRIFYRQRESGTYERNEGKQAAMDKEKMDAFVAAVKDRTDILHVVQAYVPLKARGGRYWGLCPFHHEKTPSFSVVPEKGFYYCFGCHAGGNAFNFLSKIENITYFEAIKMQAEKLGIPMPSRHQSKAELEQEREREDLRKVNAMARDFYHNCLTLTRFGAPGKKYFAGRGIKDATIAEFHLGYAPDAWDKLSSAFQKRGVSEELLIKTGLASPRKNGAGVYDRFRGRVIIPIADIRGQVVGFGGRVLDDSKPKYLNTPETILFNKRRLLFGLDRAHRAIQDADYAIIVEGYMDAISVFDAGVHNVVASLGTAFTAEHAKLLLRYTSNLVFCYDSDEAGQKATMRALTIVRNTGANVRVIVVPDGKDPDEFIRKHGADAFRKLAADAKDLVEYRLAYVLSHVRYDTLAGKTQVIQEMAPVLAGIRDAARVVEYRRRLAQTLMLDEGVVSGELRRYAKMDIPEERDVRLAAAKQRPPARKPDDALEKAGRIVVRMVWADPELLAHVKSMVPIESIPVPEQREILGYIGEVAAEGGTPDDVQAAAALSEAAGEELARAIAGDDPSGHVDDDDEAATRAMQAYQDSLQALRNAYLEAQYMEHTRLAENAMREGNTGLWREETQKAMDFRKQKIE